MVLIMLQSYRTLSVLLHGLWNIFITVCDSVYIVIHKIVSLKLAHGRLNLSFLIIIIIIWAQKNVHFLCLEPRETDKSVLKFSKNLILKFHFLLLGALHSCWQYTYHTNKAGNDYMQPPTVERWICSWSWLSTDLYTMATFLLSVAHDLPLRVTASNADFWITFHKVV